MSTFVTGLRPRPPHRRARLSWTRARTRSVEGAWAHASPTDEPELASHVHQNVETIGSLVSEAEQKITRQQRAIERVPRVIGRPRTLSLVIPGVAAWVVFNVDCPRFGLPSLDQPPFVGLQGAIAFTALLTTLMVLTTQNREMRFAERRAHLDLQVNRSS